MSEKKEVFELKAMAGFTQSRNAEKVSHHLACIGFGPTGLALFSQLIKKLEKTPRSIVLHLLDPSVLVTGVAFGAQNASHLMNTTVGGTSLYHSQPDDFFEWLLPRPHLWRSVVEGNELDPGAFVPRFVFGEYLKHRMEQVFAKARRLGIDVRIHRTSVQSLSKKQNGFALEAGDGMRFSVDSVAVCTGNFKVSTYPQLSRCPGFIPDIYAMKGPSDSIPKKARVLVIGTKLSAIDAAVLLMRRGHEGQIVMSSRSGYLPIINRRVNLRHKTYTKFLNPSDLKHFRSTNPFASFSEGVVHLTGQAIKDVQPRAKEWSPELLQARTPLSDFVRDYGDAKRGDRAWEKLMLPLMELVESSWPSLPTAERAEFFKRYGKAFYRYASSFPLQNAHLLYSALQSRKLKLQGGLENVSYVAEKSNFRAQFSGGKIIDADCVIDASGYSNGAQGTESALFRQIHKDGLFATNGFGGFAIDPDTYEALSPDGVSIKGCYLLGYPVKGSVPFANWFDRIVGGAAVIGNHLVDSFTVTRRVAS